MLSTLAKNYFNVECNYNSVQNTRDLKDLVYFRYDDGEKFVFLICFGELFWTLNEVFECLLELRLDIDNITKIICSLTGEDTSNSGNASLILERHESSASTCVIKILPISGSYYNIEAIDIVCNAKHLEVYALNEAYLVTEQGVRVDEVLGFNKKTFILQHSFEQPVSGCILKLPLVSEVCLHSMHITIKSYAEPNRSLPSPAGNGTNMLQQLINNLGFSSTPGAASPSSNKDSNFPIDMGSLLSSLLGASSIKDSRDNYTSNIPTRTTSLKAEKSNNTEEIKVKNMDLTPIENNLKSYMDHLVANLEEKIMSRLDKIEQMISGMHTNGLA